jgi:transcription regulator MmyB-like protein
VAPLTLRRPRPPPRLKLADRTSPGTTSPTPEPADFYADWDGAADTTVALLRAEAGRHPHDKALRDLVGELSTLSPAFRTR